MIHPGERFCGCVQYHARPVLLKKLCLSRGGKSAFKLACVLYLVSENDLWLASAFPLYSVQRFLNSCESGLPVGW